MLFNPHPPLTAFPPVILVLLACREVAAFFVPSLNNESVVRSFLLIALAVFTPMTFFSGYWGADAATQISQTPPELMELHQNLARLLLLLIVPTVVLGLLIPRAKHPSVIRKLYQGSLILTLALGTCVGYQGAQLVFEHGAAVKREIK